MIVHGEPHPCRMSEDGGRGGHDGREATLKQKPLGRLDHDISAGEGKETRMPGGLRLRKQDRTRAGHAMGRSRCESPCPRRVVGPERAGGFGDEGYLNGTTLTLAGGGGELPAPSNCPSTVCSSLQ